MAFFNVEQFSILKNGFRAISFKKICVLDSNFIPVGQVRFRVESTNYFGSHGLFSTLKNGFRSINFEKISVLHSYFIHEHIIIKYRSSSI